MRDYFDVLVVGKGCAGLSLCLNLPSHYKVALISKSAQSNSHYAQGGISCFYEHNDGVAEHIQDTLSAGHHLNNKKNVETIIKLAPKITQQLQQWNMPFTRNAEGKLHLHQEGGHKHARILHHLDKTGNTLMQTLAFQQRSCNNIQEFQDHCTLAIFKQKHGWLVHVFNLKTMTYRTLYAKCLVLSTGGASGIFKNHTGTSNFIGEGAYLALQAGAMLSNMEFVQFHPTCLYSKAPQFLISEAVRGEGAYILNDKKEPFLHNIDSRAEIAPRDVVANGIDRVMRKTHAPHVWLDARHVKNIAKKFPTIYAHCLQWGWDAQKHLLPIVPAAHYTCGGIATQTCGRTKIDALYAIGETADCGFHGANRLASNSLLECLAMSSLAALDIQNTIESAAPNHLKTHSEPTILKAKWEAEDAKRFVKNIQTSMSVNVGIFRRSQDLLKQLETLNRWNEHYDILQSESENKVCAYWDKVVQNHWVVAKSITTAALQRKNSLGCHTTNINTPHAMDEKTLHCSQITWADVCG